MSREVRRVPADWKHPMKKSWDGRDIFQPMFDRTYSEAVIDHEKEITDYMAKGHNKSEAEEYCGRPPDPAYYRPAWPEESRTHLQMYETTSEGTPISPVMKTAEELAKWLTDNNASAFAHMTATYEHWLYLCKGGWGPSMMSSSSSGWKPGFVYLAEKEKSK